MRMGNRLRLVSIQALVASSAAMLLSCSQSEPAMVLESPPQGTPSAPIAGSAAPPAEPPSGTAGSAAPVAQPSGSPSASAGAGGDVPTMMGEGQAQDPDDTPDDTPVVDCTAVPWANPGGVPVPELVAVADDAGKGMPFEQRAGLEDYDYVMQEFFFTGTSPAYTTRMVVKRPRDPAKFSGTVFVEWYNVSGGIDFAVLWANSREYFMREGHVFVGVSAQAVGANALKDTVDPERYASIDHPGDSAADAIFSQAAAAIRTETETLLGPCMPVHAVLAAGQSQSGFRLASYVDNTQPKDQVYDGHLIHSGLEPMSNDPGVPVFVVMTMSEGNGSLSDGPTLVKWVVAGATHNDARVTTRGQEIGEATGMMQSFECINPLNEYPSYRVYSAALDWLNRWVRAGERPPPGTPFEMSGSQLALDAHDNVLGGVRSPDIDVPVATYGFDNGPTDPLDFIGALACGLGGTTVPFTEAELLQLYPTHEDYVEQYTAAADEALASGHVLQADYDEAIAQAQAAKIPN